MEFGFTEEQQRFRKEVHDYFMNEVPENFDAEPAVGASAEEQALWWELQKKTSRKGWTTASWPKKYGGLGWSAIELGIYNEEMAYWRVRFPSWSQFQIHGPTILIHGTEEQKQKLIPPITRGEQRWMNAVTEPEAGSDNANAQLRAVKDGDYYILNGQKTFISSPRKPQYFFTLAKTADVIPKHRGLSIFVIPADTPGITYRPWPAVFGGMQHDIFFDDVRVHKDCLLGDLNRGFYVTMTSFEFERASTGAASGAKRELEEFLQFCKEEKRNGKPLIEDPEIRKILARRAVEVTMMRLAGWHSTWWSSERERLGPRPPSLTTAHWSKMLGVRWAKETMDILNLYGQLKRDSKWAKLFGRIERQWLNFRSEHQGGTVEIYKNVVAERGLGLPRWRNVIAARAEAREKG